ncbi:MULTISPECIES: NAD(P)/FAD-dependent oxidoreductase [unclassified Mycobacterium]|uniref:flavin-containing monooxygenase n=1 Tax=unclassified Mycobacterium TaxID=2642494 RepID=UPI000740042B|nr:MULTISPECIES: NAD(P)/FAD-dependent oxidoreductase [unclassified Mycobacterium]KUH87743.1 monooxygenase [Mycobacterium sp. GA-0227b]KUH87790.1 monooxygenase [Mycobacterium sp. GA-1999]KUH88682.1 monooxygenase [Mycobacterium sp. IS-1556]
MRPDYHTVVVGAGFSGIGTAIKLEEAGFGDYLVIEAGDGVGGTWHWNNYPGIAVDIPSFSYQFSFEQRPDWSRTYAPGNELKAYADHCVDKYGIRSKIRFNTKVLAAAFDDEHALWRVQTDPGGEITARFLVNASGVLTVPKLPDIDGVDSFGGITMHTARWDHTQDLTGKRVGVIGTGASAIQVIPEIAPIVKELTVFQRTAIWCFPKFDVMLPRWSHWLMRLPGGKAIQRWVSQAFVEATTAIPVHYFTVFPLPRWMERAGRAYLRRQVKDPVLREKLTPRYAIGCKRLGLHNDYLSTFNRDNVRLVIEPIDKITSSAVATTDGENHEIDVLVLATGFNVLDIDVPTFAITGSGGRSLSRFWGEHRFQAYEGVTVPGFPNLFHVFGPYGYVGSSYFALIEAQGHHIVRCLKEADRRVASRVEVTREANDRYFDKVMRRRHRQVFWQDSCRVAHSYYFDKNGDVPFLRPTTTVEAYWRSRRFDLDDYRFTA